MTTELQTAMARYEEARSRYQKAVLGSLGGVSNGDAIRQAIHEFQTASKELRRLRPHREAALAPQRAPAKPERAEEKPALTPLDFVWRLLRAS